MRVAIIGAGPIGIEAGLHAQAAGHEVVVYEAGPEPAWSLARWGHVQMFTPWRMNTTPEGRAFLGDPAGLDGDDFPSGAALRARYLLPIAQSLDVQCGHRLVAASRSHMSKSALLGSRRRAAEPFRLLLHTDQGEEMDLADVLLDCSGTFDQPTPAGPGGLPVLGEADAERVGLVRRGPAHVHDLAGKQVVLVGDGASAVTVLQALLTLTPPAKVTWLTPSSAVPGFHSPDDDVLPGRRALWTFGRDAVYQVDHRPGAWLSRIARTASGLQVELESGQSLRADCMVVTTGFRPDLEPLRELQFHACWGTEGPMKLAAALLATRGGGGGDCLADAAPLDADSLRSPEPRLFVLGSKSYGRRSDFLLENGFEQVRQVIDLLSADPG